MHMHSTPTYPCSSAGMSTAMPIQLPSPVTNTQNIVIDCQVTNFDKASVHYLNITQSISEST